MAWPPATPAGRSPSGWDGILDGVPRELARNGCRRRYWAQRAAADRQAARPKPSKLAVEPRLRAVVEAKLALLVTGADCGLAADDFPNDPTIGVV